MSTISSILLWLGWGALVAVGSVVTLFMTAFGDSPRANLAVRRAITPVVLWIALVVILGGVALINRGQWWSVLLAYALAPSPPFVFLGLVSLLMAGGRGRNSS